MMASVTVHRGQSVLVLLASYNRQRHTLHCLKSVFSQLGKCARIEALVVDDASSDGTAAAIAREFPIVRVLRGTGDLYWSGAMRLAMSVAIREHWDFVLWLNDDVVLYEDAVATLLGTQARLAARHPHAIVVGTVRDPETGRATYGGVVREPGIAALGFRLVTPSPDQPVPCDTMHGNCVLIPDSVLRTIGNMSPDFSHAIADFDYGLRARREGVGIYVAPGYVGTCKRDSVAPFGFDPTLSLRQRYMTLQAPKGLPNKEWRIFVRTHAGPTWRLVYAKWWMRLLAPRLWQRLRRFRFANDSDHG